MHINEFEKKSLLKEKYSNIATLEYQKECVLIDAGMPVAYLIGHIPFLGAHIDLSLKPLIPRAETEYWVNEVLKDISRNYSLEILDIFSGSGCIGLGLLNKLANSRVDFAELQEQNIAQIYENLKLNNIEASRFNTYQSDVFTSIPTKEYDYIFANPPYIDPKRKNQVQQSVQDHEDSVALYAKQHGLQFIYELIKKGSTYLKEGGLMYIEYDYWQTNIIKKYVNAYPLWELKIMKDQYNKDRVLVLKKRHT